VALPDLPGTFRRSDGSTIFVDENTAPLRADDGTVGSVVVFSDVTERREMEAQLRRFAEEDALTGLPNRRSLEQAVAARLDAGLGGALLLLDLDHFKFVNDSFGHAAGDDLIRAVAVALREQTRDGDMIGRLGGDEFAILLPGALADETSAIAERLISGIEAARPSGLTIGASIGAACFAPGDGGAAGDLLVAADIALYEAKNAGRGRVAFFSGRPGSSLTWVQRIRAALDEGRMVLHAQPIFDLATGEHVHCELLVRMLDENRALVPPSSFLPTAESFGLIGDIDRWVLARGVETAATGRCVHINLSGSSLGSADVLGTLESSLRETGADPGNVVIEVTETLAVANMAQARAFAHHVRRLGCSLALDDFGTGFGSFTYLKNIPADFLKIDMSFVRELASSEADQGVVDAIVGIAGRFGLRTIAEGVEDEATLLLLEQAGVDLAQGYHLGRPAAL
jgi:diguanylate cyclase (GGDEF)-like protein